MPEAINKEERIKYEFSAKPWKYPGKGTWHFVSLPIEISKEIRGMLKWQEEGWGRLKTTAQTGTSEWATALWFDTKHETYLLPLKANVRKKEKIEMGKDVEVTIWL